MKQPAVGIVSTLVIAAIALSFISLFSFATFTGWVATMKQRFHGPAFK